MNGKSLVLFAAMAALTACAARKDSRLPQSDLKGGNEWLVRDYFNQQADNGLLADSTIRENHFLPNSAEFSMLGVRDMKVFARHYHEHPGHLNVRRGGASDELYSARVVAVREYLENAGVTVERVSISDGLPTSPGTDTESALLYLYDREKPDYGNNSGYDSGSSSGSGSMRR